MHATKTYDVVIIGAGHNGLILGGYLARAGLKCIAIEHRLEGGGGLSTEEITIAGYWNNMHSIFHEGINLMRPYTDLELEDFHCWYVRPPVVAGLPTRDGRSLVVYTDLEQTCRSIARFSPADADTWRTVATRFAPVVRDAVIPALFTPPGQLDAALESSAAGREYRRLAQLTPRQVVDELFTDEHVKGLILHHILIPRGAAYDYGGRGDAVIRFITQVEHSMLCIGGSHILAHALIRSYARAGGHVWATARVERILVEDGRAVGVELTTGERVMATKAVVSTVDLRQTFEKFVGRSKVGDDVAAAVRNWELDEFSIFSVHLNLAEPPRYKDAYSDVAQALKLDIGLDTPADHEALWAAIRAGRLPERPGLIVTVPTLHDPKQAPRGHHTAVLWSLVPFALKDANWNAVKKSYARQCLDVWREYATNLTASNIEFELVITPPELFNKQLNMAQGSIFMGKMSGQQLQQRPFPALAQYRTPVDGLYLAGSAAWPGGGVTGAPAYNAAGVIADDVGVDRWWQAPAAD